ncbi:MAG: hypothetical protein QOI11_3536 [Candidatus Eremiobacteraeota bacterium]|jgi:hypothetical protein|nr:hypothetical protein [Candidatus Eremiobacteraeota bacterium]
MAGYKQYTSCCSEAGYFSLGAHFIGAALIALIVLMAGGALVPGVALAAVLCLLAYCRWWLYSRLICNGGDRCVLGFVYKVEPPQGKSGLDRFDTDYSISIVLAPLLKNENFASTRFLGGQAELMQQTDDNRNHGHEFSGEPIDDDKSTAVFHCEFEGGGVYDLMLACLAALPFLGIAAATCSIPVIGWIICLICGAIALAAIIVGIVVGLNDTGSPSDAGAPAELHDGSNGQKTDIVVVFGTWIYDSAHSGWNELHPIKHCQLVGEWTGAWPADWQSILDRYCTLIRQGTDPATVGAQGLPQNGWTVHPLVDGCAPAETPPPLR